MFKNSIVGIFVLMVTMFLAAESSFAQPGAPGGTPGVLQGTLLGVGNGNRGAGNQSGDTYTRRYKLGRALAAEAMSHLNYGSRYLLVLSRSQDPNTGCMVEGRAWISRVEANDGTNITVLTGPARSVSICNGSATPTVQQINQAEVNIQLSRRWIAELQTNPSRYTNVPAWINYYTQIIANNQAFVLRGMPQ